MCTIIIQLFCQKPVYISANSGAELEAQIKYFLAVNTAVLLEFVRGSIPDMFAQNSGSPEWIGQARPALLDKFKNSRGTWDLDRAVKHYTRKEAR